jgi:hypothetical protein
MTKTGHCVCGLFFSILRVKTGNIAKVALIYCYVLASVQGQFERSIQMHKILTTSLALALLATTTNAATNFWTGAADTDWYKGGN